jgi:uncharacterized membrane protein
MKFLSTLVKRYLLSGILILSPILITIWIFTSLTLTLDGVFKPLMELAAPKEYTDMLQETIPFEIHGYGLIFTFVIIIIAGAIARNFIGQYFIGIGEKLITKIPLIPKVYNGIKQVMGTFIRDDTQGYNGVALVEYPRKGLYTLALITGTPDPIFSENINDENIVSLYVPTTPNPTSGFYLVAKESEIKRLNIPIDMALKLILSCGIIQNPTREVPAHKA